MKVRHEKTVKVVLELNEMEATALAQLCVQVGGVFCLRRDFYHEVWRELREALGEIPHSRGLFTYSGNAILCTGDESTQHKGKADV